MLSKTPGSARTSVNSRAPKNLNSVDATKQVINQSPRLQRLARILKFRLKQA